MITLKLAPGSQSVIFSAIPYEPRKKTFLIPSTYLRESGVLSDRDVLVLFCRGQFAKQMEFMADEVMNKGSYGWILGSPGIGKSSTAFAFLTSRLDDTGWIFTWMYFDSAQVLCVRFNNNQRKERRFSYREVSVLQDYLDEDSADDKKHFVFLDGYVGFGSNSAKIISVADECEIWLLKNRETRRLCILCSMSSRGKSKLDDDRRKKVMVHRVSSWVSEEYHLAFAQRQIRECFGRYLDAGFGDKCATDDTEQLVESKVYFAGGCARYLFAYKTEDVIKDLRSAIESCQDILPYVTGTVGEKSEVAVNRLICHFEESKDHFVHSLVSKFVASELSLQQGPRMVQRIAETLRAGRNPVLEGLLFEMWFFALIGYGELQLNPQAVGIFSKDRVVDFDPSGIIAAIPSVDRVWYKPLKWNQGGFDAVHVVYSSKAVTFVQITVSENHSLKLEHFASMIRNLSFRPHSVEILFLVPQLIASKFRVSKWTGLGELKTFTNTKKKKWDSHNEKGMVKICTFVQHWDRWEKQ